MMNKNINTSYHQGDRKTTLKGGGNPQKIIWDQIETSVRRYIQAFIEEILEAEIKEKLKADPYERTEDRLGYRNGHYQRSLGSRYGEIEDINIPRLRKGRYQYQAFNHWQRRTRHLEHFWKEYQLVSYPVSPEI
jgi:putative transposase